MTTVTDLKVWNTIRLGTGLRSPHQFRLALKNIGCRIDFWAEDMLEQTASTSAETEQQVDLVKVRMSELGLEYSAPQSEILQRGVEGFGLELCTAEVGPQLCIQVPWLPLVSLRIAMKPIIAQYKGPPRKFPMVYGVGRGVNTCTLNPGPLGLNGSNGRPEERGEFYCDYIFMKPRN